MATAAVAPRPVSRVPLPAVAGLLVAAPAALLTWLLTHPAIDGSLAAPLQHFYIVTSVSLLAFALAGVVAIAAMQIAQ